MQGTTGDRADRTFTGAKPQGQKCSRCGAVRTDRQIGLEPTPDDFVASIVAVFREVRRVLRSDGVAWLVIGDTYFQGSKGDSGELKVGAKQATNVGSIGTRRGKALGPNRNKAIEGIKPKDLVGVPWKTAHALQRDGWYLRDAIIWSKAEVDEFDELEGSCMPGSQRDRCTFAYEFVFMLAKSRQYYFDQEGWKTTSGSIPRNVWRINPEPTKFNHFATFPRELARRCILLGTSAKGCCPECGKPWAREVESDRVPTRPGGGSKVWADNPADPHSMHSGSVIGNRDPFRHTSAKRTTGWNPACRHAHEPIPCVVADCFSGMSTVGVAADALGRRYVGLDLSMDYLRDAKRRLERPHAPIRRPPKKTEDLPLFSADPKDAA